MLKLGTVLGTSLRMSLGLRLKLGTGPTQNALVSENSNSPPSKIAMGFPSKYPSKEPMP